MVSCFWDQDWIPVKHSSVNIQLTNEFNKSSNSYTLTSETMTWNIPSQRFTTQSVLYTRVLSFSLYALLP